MKTKIKPLLETLVGERKIKEDDCLWRYVNIPQEQYENYCSTCRYPSRTCEYYSPIKDMLEKK